MVIQPTPWAKFPVPDHFFGEEKIDIKKMWEVGVLLIENSDFCPLIPIFVTNKIYA